MKDKDKYIAVTCFILKGWCGIVHTQPFCNYKSESEALEDFKVSTTGKWLVKIAKREKAVIEFKTRLLSRKEFFLLLEV